MFDFLEHLFVSAFNWLTRPKRRPKPLGGCLTIGYRVIDGQVTKRPVQLSLTVRSMHTAIVGKSGSGKTSYIKSDCASAIKANRGLFVIDLQGDLTPFLLGTIAALEIERQTDLSERLIFISPTDRGTSVGLNPLEGIGGDFARTTEIAEVLRQHSHQDYLGPRTEELLRNAVLALEANGLTLADLVPLLADARFRARCVANISNVEVRAFFESRYDKASEPLKATMREPILNKISAFTADPRFRHIVGQSRSTFSMKDGPSRR